MVGLIAILSIYRKDLQQDGYRKRELNTKAGRETWRTEADEGNLGNMMKWCCLGYIVRLVAGCKYYESKEIPFFRHTAEVQVTITMIVNIGVTGCLFC